MTVTAWQELLGYSKDEVLGKWLGDFMTTESASEFKTNFTKFLSTGKACGAVMDMVTKKKEILKISITGRIAYDENGNFTQTYCILQDVTAQLKAEKALVESEKKFKLMFDEAPMGYQSLDEDGYFLEVNKAWLDMLGYKKQEVIGNWFGDFLAPEYVERFKTNFPKFKHEGKTCTVFDLVRKNKEKVTVSFEGRIGRDESGNFRQTHCLLQDVTAQMKAEKALVESENKHKAMIANISDVIGILDADGVIKYKSPNIEDQFGWGPDDLINMDAFVTVHPDDAEYIRGELAELLKHPGSQKTVEYRYLCKDGTYTFINLVAVNLLNDKMINGVLMNYHDISVRKRLEEDKREMEAKQVQQQRLESIGTLAGGVAHEINNPINGIMNYGQLILDSSDIEGENAQYAKEIIAESERIAEIVRNLLQFSRQEKQGHSYADIETIVGSTMSLIKTVIRHDQIDLQVDITKGLPPLKCRSQQIQQVIMNLLTNARDSLNEKYKGYDENKIIRLHCEQFVKQNRDWIRITVEDFGTGIPKSVRERLFEPFYTTKDRSSGTGLGLPISYGIAKEHNGDLTFETKEGSFTKFHLELPCDNGWELKSEESSRELE